MSGTLEVTVSVPAFDHDALLAIIHDWNLNGVVQEGDTVRLYLPAGAWTTAKEEALSTWLDESGHEPDVDTRLVPPQNWNAIWEESIEPVRAGSFWVTPTWANVPAEPSTGAAAHVIEVDPKMSFGTGHHATTRLVLRLLDGAVREGDRLLDIGTGTGILAVAACRLGAARALGVDISEDAVANARETAALNDVGDRLEVRLGTVEDVVAEDGPFNVICANVTRDVLRTVVPALPSHVTSGARLLLSGVFERDRAAMVELAAEVGFQLDAEATEDGWWGGRFDRRE